MHGGKGASSAGGIGRRRTWRAWRGVAVRGRAHRFVHRFAGREELARRYYTVELLMGEVEVEGAVIYASGDGLRCCEVGR